MRPKSSLRRMMVGTALATSNVRLLNARIWPWSRPASLTRTAAWCATRKSSTLLGDLVRGELPGGRHDRRLVGERRRRRVDRIEPAPALRCRRDASPAAGSSRRRPSAAPTRTMRSFTRSPTLSRNAVSASASGGPAATAASAAARTAPSVEGVQASTSPTSASLTGETMCAREALVQPAGMAEVPRLEMRVHQPPLLELMRGPLAGLLEVRRAGEPRPVARRSGRAGSS